MSAEGGDTMDGDREGGVGRRVGWSVLLATTLFVAGLLRFTGLNWDLAQWIHPDEGHMRMITSAIRLPEEPGLYFDTARSPLNPRNHNQTYSYGTLPLFATRALAEWVERGCVTPDRATVPALNARVARVLLRRAGASVATGVHGAPACPAGTFTWTYNAFLGRHLAALADLGTVLLLFLVGRRLYGTRVGLMAMALGAVTTLLIQQAHFYTVDSAAAFFTMLTALFAVRAAGSRRIPWCDLALGGVAVGLAAACKVSAAVAAGLVALGALAWALRRKDAGMAPDAFRLASGVRGLPRALAAVALPLVLAGVLAGVAFRVGQPYAFEGPGFLGVRPDADWFGRLRQIGEEQSGVLDYPSGRQWTNRWPVLFPWLNMVVWGMGLPLGLVVCAGWVMAGVELVRGHGVGRLRYAHLVPWVWSTLYLAFYATRWVKAMRYFTPVYPLLILMGAYALARLVRTSPPPPFPSPTPELRGQGPRGWRLAVVVLVVAGTAAWGTGFFTIYLRPHTRVAGSRWIYANVPPGSVIANEHWDWGLPLRIDGRDGFREGYTGLTLELYNEDTPEKLAQLLAQLDDADYLVMASNRLYGSIPRLPERYPLTTTYYRALFVGELGFELAAEFTSYIRIGPFVFPDQENPFPLMAPVDFSTQGHLPAVPLPPAEESFSVYDHPDCLIFRKTPAYSRERVEAVLGTVDLSAAQAGLSPHEATPAAVKSAHTVAFAIGLAATAVVVGFVIFGYRKPPGEAST